jgi:hypothetical protein
MLSPSSFAKASAGFGEAPVRRSFSVGGSKHEGGPLRLLNCCLVLVVGACVAACSSGSLSAGIRDVNLAQAYIELPKPDSMLAGGAAVVIAPGIAVTNRHNANLVPPDDILATSDRFDILFYRTARKAPALKTAEPGIGREVVAYGQGADDSLREASGPIELIEPGYDECPGCPQGTAFAYRAPAGPGFSGRPVTDAETGAILGLTFADIDSPIEAGEPRLMLAHSMAQIRAEMERLRPQ